MTLSNNHEPRRTWKRSSRSRGCIGCGRRIVASAALPFCAACVEWARQRNLMEWDDLGVGD